MATIRSIDFLPEIFQTPVNRQFLAATLDQLIQEPQFKKTQGFVGRKVGPGVNPRDSYIIEPTKSRNDYQLEPGVVGINPDTLDIQDVITYPGITDALALEGAITDNANRLYTSEYYSWDPFVDFDKFVNYQQYYWLPDGPEAVDVSISTVPLTDNFVVTRADGVYTFSGIAGKDPVLTLVRGGNYTFQIAQNNKETENFRVTNDRISSYQIDYQPNPTLTLVRGNTYTFTFSLTGIFPFYIKTIPSLGNINTYDTGVTNNGATTGTLTFVVPQDAPDILYYCSSNEFNLRGQFTIIDAVPGNGPGFWIQTDPGINGTIPSTPNISSRTILGVSNNGTDLGTITFNVPHSTAQNFYYTLPNIGTVDLVTNLEFDQINDQPVAQFMLEYGGIDGIIDLRNRTLIFQYNAAGWGDIPEDQRYSLWSITYVNVAGVDRIKLSSVETINNLEKFAISFGTTYSSTSWYKTAEGVFEQIPLLTAAKQFLYYQDGADPEIFGRIQLIDQVQDSTLKISDIIRKPNYTSPNGVVFTNGLKVIFRGNVEPASYENTSYYVEGVGTAIKLLPVSDFITPELYVEEEYVIVENLDSTLSGPVIPDYLTINRASKDLNPWTRSNRWFHVDVINATAEYNNTIPVVDNAFRGRRPILEFRAGTKLIDFATQGKQPINIIDFTITDAFSTVDGTIGYGIDGYTFVEGTTVVFAADTDPDVRRTIYQVQFVVPDTVLPLIPEPIITLVPVTDGTVLIDQGIVCLSGLTLTGLSFYYDGISWLPAQNKTKVNQAPLFNLYDSTGISFADRAKYPSSTFRGSKLLSYAIGNGAQDPVLGFPLKYLSLTNIGDIVFDNNLYADSFVYVDNSVSTTVSTSTGFVRQYLDRITYIKEIGWQTAVTPSLTRQQFQFTYEGKPLQLDVKVDTNNVVPAVQLFVNARFQDPSTYTVQTTNNTTIITLSPTSGVVITDVIEVSVLSNQISTVGFYQVPINLSNNPLNANSNTFTLGTIRSHYGSIAENLLGLQGPINGSNNTRDLGNIVPYGLQILQQSSPLTLTGYFTRNLQYDIFASIAYNSKEYTKFKSLLLNTVVRNEYDSASVADILDSAIAEITLGRTDINPFYWSDMLPTGSVFTQTSTTINFITTPVFDTTQTYNFTSANFLGLLVYLTRSTAGVTETTLLERNVEYIVSTDGPTLTVTTPLAVGDVITIREYSSTAGNFVPNTPSKMGLYPKFRPAIFMDNSYINPTLVIRGHDGSITIAFGDIRDQVLLEFEKRIYNNIKTDGNPVPLTIEQVEPGFFRTTDYTQSEITDILGESFLTWVGWNKLDYKTQDYLPDNPFTYNYSSAGSKLTTQNTISSTSEPGLLGAWRGIYNYYYDTITPATTPWEMLGITEEPDWWVERYGPAPYTSDNLVLWDDLELGLVADPVAPYIKPNFARPGLTKVIPVGTEGQQLSPMQSIVGQYDPNAFRKSWVVGDGGPVEASWWASSDYPYAVMRLLALTRPAEFFSLFADRDLYKFSAEFDQYLYNGRYRLDANGIEIYGNGVSKASYINWIVDYNQQLGRNSTDALTTDLANIDVRLCWRLAAFTDKQYLKIFTEKSSPNSQNSSLLIPDDSYNLLLYKNQPFAEIIYSALIVEQVDNGYAVYGYSTTSPYFKILASATSGVLTTVSAGGTSVRVPAQYTNNIVQVPYGYVFTNTTTVVDFILSYGAYLESQGLIFSGQANGYQLNWNQMAQEFLYFSQQGWAPGTLINLNPVANQLTAVKAGAVVDTIESLTPENMLLDQNRQALPTRNLIINRDGNTFTINSTDNQTISFLHLRFTNYENIVVLDNVSIFADLIYDPVTSARQDRIKVVASMTTEWNGQLDAQGFILNQNNVKEWVPNRKYTKGEIVLYKNTYWSAQTIVQPKLLFDYNDWVKSNYSVIQKGLLVNIANKADQLANSYNTNGANLERDNDLLSYGLIGFRPREYMTALNLDDTSQVNIYQQFLGSKGTIRAAELFTRADLGKESGEYSIFENWGVLAGTYGANANRSFFELRLNEALLQSDPSVVQVIMPQEHSDADQTILLSNVWRESFKLTSPDILPTTYSTPTDTALPSAGYVNVEDVDITVFSLNDPSNIAQYIDSIGIGTSIWVAKINPYDWDIYRCERVAGRLTQLSDNLNGTSVAQFSAQHNLKIGDLIIVRYFNNSVNGVYRVVGVPGVQQVIISFSFNNTNQTTITGDGLVFYLQTARVSQASDVLSLPYANSLVSGARVWVDNDGSGHWEVLEKQNPFTVFDQLLLEDLVSNSQYGATVAQSIDHATALIGSPGINGAEGRVYTYRRDATDRYAYNIELQLNAIDVIGFGDSLDFGNTTWGIIGASKSNAGAGYALLVYIMPGTNDYVYSQLLVAPDEDFSPINFGASVTISQNEQWLYVGAPAGNRVYAYGKVDVELQSATYITDGFTTAYNYANTIRIDSNFPQQLVISLDNLQSGLNVDLIYAIDYVVDGVSVILLKVPSAGLKLSIKRRLAAQIDSTTYYGVLPNVSTGSGYNSAFTINVTRGVYYPTIISAGSGYNPGDILTIYGDVIGGDSPANDLTINIVTVDDDGAIVEFTWSGTGIDNTTIFQLTPYLFTATNIYSFTIQVDGQIQRPNIDYVFNPIGQELTFITVPAAGAVIGVIAGTYWQYTDTISLPDLSADAEFGQSITTTTDGRQVFIGCAKDNATNSTGQTVPRAGSVYAIDRSVIRYLITDPTQTTYNIPGINLSPISVLLNDTFLTNTDQYIRGQFTVDGDNIILSSDVILTVGDILEIESNQFQVIQKIVDINPKDEEAFGSAVQVCPTDCSLYIGAPLATNTNQQEGSAQRNINQSRLFGVITSTRANPILTAGNTIRINNTEVAVPYGVDENIQGLVAAINSAEIPNVLATLTPDLMLYGDGHTKIFDVGSIYSAAESYRTVVYIDSVLQTEGVTYTYNNVTQQIAFVTAPVSSTVITVVSGRMTINVINSQATVAGNKLTVLPGVVGTTDDSTESVFDCVGFVVYYYVQTIHSPNPTDYAYFGSSLDINTSAVNLVIGAPNGNVYEAVIFDGGETYFDDRSTTFFSPIQNSGVAYTFDYLPSAVSSITNPGAFVFGQQIYDANTKTNDKFATAVSYRGGRLLVGAPGDDIDSQNLNYGQVNVFSNPTDRPAWTIIHAQQPTVKIDQINSVFMYDRLTSSTQHYFDYFNPLQGKILGAAARNINYIGAVDPADYNTGTVHNLGNSWAAEHVGEIWWDTDTVRFIDPNQDSITYASRRWGQVFPGSRVDIYQWIASSVPPVSYTGPGIALSTTSYTVSSKLNQYNIFETIYYFWVRGLTTIDINAGKTLSTTGIASYIENPRGSGIPYIAPINASTVAIYNALDFISAQDTILHIEYDRQFTSANIHQEYELIADGQADSFLNNNLYRKLQDSFCGVDNAGASVPDPILSPAERYGVQFRPRQSMFIDRFGALQNYLTHANRVFLQFPIVEIRKLSLLNSSEPEPQAGTGQWDKRVANLEELSFQNLFIVPLGYRYLVVSDSNQNGLWTIYIVADGALPGERVLNLIRVQNYDTRKYWDAIDWYLPGYNSTINPIAEVPTYTALDTLTYTQAPIGSSVKVTANAQGKFEIYLRTNLGWTRVGLENGTIAIKEEIWNYSAGNFGFDVEGFDSQYFDEEPVIETRKIIQAINEELFIDELLIERNRSLILMFNFIYSEFSAPSWLIKTSLVDVNHNIRALLPFQNYLRDNQDFVLNYIQEVKPYHVQIREFNLTYNGNDQYPGTVTDFDVPAFYNSTLVVPQFVSPILLPFTEADTTIRNNTSNTPANAEVWMATPWDQWYNNYLLSIQGVTVVNGGAGYTVPPTVVVTGDCIEPATMTAIINSTGRVVAVEIDSPGAGYSTTATLTLVGGNGVGAQAVSIMGNDLVRSIKTVIKYDRYQYATTIVDWEPNVPYDNGTQVRYLDKVWEASNSDSTVVESPIFNIDQWTIVDPGTLSGVDRTMGLYVPTVNQPGLSLPLLIDGVEYPGVQVFGLNYDQNTGFDVGNYDVTPFDNISYSPEGVPTYDPAILDAEYGSSYTDLYLGTRPTDINVDGGGYIDVFSSYAPEELIPGSEFDTLDFRVYTRAGADWSGKGHGFPWLNVRFIFDPLEPVVPWNNIVPYAQTIIVSNITSGLDLTPVVDYTIDWVAQTVTLVNGAASGDIVTISVYGLGGGNQLYENTYIGSEIGNTVSVPVLYTQIQEFAIFVDGILTTDYTYGPRYADTGTQAVYNPVGSDGTTLVVTSTVGIQVGALIVGYGFTSSQTVVTKIDETRLIISAAPDFQPDGTLTFKDNTGETKIVFGTTYTGNEVITITAIGPTSIDNITSIAYSWSAPQTQYIVAPGSTLTFDLTNSLEYSNPDNLIVTVNGLRARTSAGIEYYGDDITVSYLVADRLGFDQAIIVATEVDVYLDDIPQTLGVDFTLDPYTGGTRQITMTQAPAVGVRVLITVNTKTQCYVNANTSQLIFRAGEGLEPIYGDLISVTTWNDTRQQDILTQVYVGPVITGILITEAYDTTDYDVGDLTGDPGSYDYTLSVPIPVSVNDLFLDRAIVNPDRLWVTHNGIRLFYGIDFTVVNDEIILSSGTIGTADVIMITQCTDNVVPEPLAFRIFQDMREVQATYRITVATTTVLTQPVGKYDDVIYVEDVTALGNPLPEDNIWGVITINGERIMYRVRDTDTNTVSSLLRGTAGTAVAEHTVGSIVNDMGRGNLMPVQFQNYITSNTITADGTSTVFIAPDVITTNGFAVEVYVGGIRQTDTDGALISLDPVTIEFFEPPKAGLEVTILIKRGVTWYAPGTDTPSNGVALQDTRTQAARFLQGH